MENENKNAEEIKEVVNPEGAEEAEIAAPQPEEGTEHTADDIMNMSEEDFGKYLEDARNGITHNIERNKETEAPQEEAEKEQKEEEQPEEADRERKEPEEVKPYKTYASEEDFEKDVQERVNHAFGKRFKNDREREEKLDVLYARAKNFIPGVTRENLIDALADDLYRQAENNGKDLTELKEKEELELKALRLEAIERQRRQQEEYNKLVERKQKEMLQQEQVIQLMDEGFSIKSRAEQDKLFEQDIRSGKTVIEAYKASKAREAKKPESAPEPEQEPPRQAKRKAIAQNATTPRKGTGDTKRDPSQYSDKDFSEYINKCKRAY